MTRSADAKTDLAKKNKGKNHPKSDLKNATHKILVRDDAEEGQEGKDLAVDVLDEHDPNYNSQDEYDDEPSDFSTTPTPTKQANGGLRRRFSSFGDDSSMMENFDPNDPDCDGAQWSLGQFQFKTNALLDEYLASGEKNPLTAVQEIVENEKYHQFGDEFVNLAFRKGLDSTKPNAVKTMEDITVAYFRAIEWGKRNSLVRGIEKLLCTWDDLILDTPDAADKILQLIERCIKEELLAKALLRKLPEAMLEHLCKNKKNEHLKPTLVDLKTFKQAVDRGLHDYFKTKQVSSVTYFLKELHQPDLHHEFVKKTICMAFDISREADGVFGFLYELYMGNHIDLDAVQWGIIRVLGALEDLKLDCPKAPEFMTGLLVHFVKNDILSAVFLKRCRLLRIGQACSLQTLQAVEKKLPDYFKKYLGMADTKYELKIMILEYFDSGDKHEVGRIIREMDVGMKVAGEIVRKIMMYSMERSGIECEHAVALLVHLVKNEQELSKASVKEGFRQLYGCMDDFKLDVPDAQEMTDTFYRRCMENGILEE